MKIKTLIGAAVVAVVVLAAAFYVYKTKFSAPPPGAGAMQRPPVEVSVYTVKAVPMVFTKDLPGRTSAFQEAEIRPQVTGIILKRMFDEGGVVEQGQQLYQIDPALYQAEYDRAVAALATAEATLQSIAPKEQRYSELVKNGSVSRQDYEDIAASAAQARSQVAVAKANVQAAKIQLDYTKVFAPISGRIGKSSVTEGALVTAGQASPLATIQNLKQIYVDVNQSSAEIMRLRKQMNAQTVDPEATLIIDGETEAYKEVGRVLFSEVTVNQGTGTVQLRILFPNPNEEILPGLFVRARVVQSKQDNVMTVPQQSVSRTPDGRSTVWLVDGTNTVNVRPIVVGDAIGDQWVVISGLNPGEKVVVEGVQKIRPGAVVTPVEPAAAAQ